MRLHILHRSLYSYPTPAALGPHQVRLRPANHARARIESYGLSVPDGTAIRWQQDPFGNHVAHLSFKKGTRLPELELKVELAVDIRPVNPFDFFLDDRFERSPFRYPEELQKDLLPFLDSNDVAVRGGPRLESFLDALPRTGKTVDLIVELNGAVHDALRYVVRDEAGIWTPEETLSHACGSCRDSAVLLIAALRSRGLAARFVSGYLIQLTDEGMIPDAPKGVLHDVVDLHAWAEVYLPGAGWIGLDATSGLLCGEGHIPLACTARPALATPVEGTSDIAAAKVGFETKVARLGHEPRPTAPFGDETWAALLAADDAVDARLADGGLALTCGGEPTFASREHPELPEWNGEALGATKWVQGLRLAAELRGALCPGAATLERQGKHYPGESIPRWALELIARRDGQPIWADAAPSTGRPATVEDSQRLLLEVATRLELASSVVAAFEDPWRHLQEEAALPVDVDPLTADLDDPEERRRLARVLGRGLAREAGHVLPLARVAGAWRSDAWSFRRGRLFLLPGDAPIGLRLPLASIAGTPLTIAPVEPTWDGPPDPRRGDAEKDAAARQARLTTAQLPGAAVALRTALCVEPRGGKLHVFLPPTTSAADFLALVGHVDAARRELGLDVQLGGYPPPPSPELVRLAVTPDPGVLEVNLPPVASGRAHAELVGTVFDAALRSGLTAEKYLLDGRMAGSGGGHHLTLGGPTPLESPFVRRPDLLASLITFVQHHPSLSYLFTGLFVGPTSQAPRVDEARHDSLYELEIALARAFDRSAPPAPWLSDLLFRHLLVDVSGNTHRAELCIDKLFEPRTPHGRQGLVELRAFEMPPHPRMAAAQMALVRALVAAFAAEPYQAPLVRWGTELHDRFLLPAWLWRDFEDVLGWLEARGLSLPADAYRAFVDLRCPRVGRLQAGDVTVEVRNAIEPWHVLGEEPAGGGTSRYVDSSVERIEVRADGVVEGRHEVLVNGLALPLRATGTRGERVAGVRFRAWAPPHALHAHLGIHHPLRLDVLDRWSARSLGACAYHVWHPEGRAFLSPPLTRFEAAARQARRFTVEAPLPWPVTPRPTAPHPEMPYTLDLRRYAGDRPPPDPEPEEA
ncbi:MAG: transglutaminase family protein [Anaeromyxobacteraceae bacterium]